MNGSRKWRLFLVKAVDEKAWKTLTARCKKFFLHWVIDRSDDGVGTESEMLSSHGERDSIPDLAYAILEGESSGKTATNFVGDISG